MSGLHRRLTALESIYQRPREKPSWLEGLEATADTDPVQHAVWRVCYSRAQRRWLAETGAGPRWDGDEMYDRVEPEIERLIAAGWDAWLAEGDDLPRLAGWPSDAASESAFFADEVRRMTEDRTHCRAHLRRLGWPRPHDQEPEPA